MNESMNEELFYVFGDGFNGLDRMGSGTVLISDDLEGK